MTKSLFLVSLLFTAVQADAQVVSNASQQESFPRTSSTVFFNLSDTGVETPIEWGMDLQWINEGNLLRGVRFAGQDCVDIVRCGFMPSANVSGGKLSDTQIHWINERASLVKKHCKPSVVINIGSDPAEGNGVDWWYNDGGVSSEERGRRWAKCIDLHRQKYEELGLTVVSVSPFNEPDFGWNQGLDGQRHEDFKNTAKALRQNYRGAYGPNKITICGCNTLNNDNASWWWNHCREYLDEGNTHQLAGGFDSYANFFREVSSAGQRAVADELHNVMEAMVGAEYGMTRGIWWGTAVRARGQFMKATHVGDGGQPYIKGTYKIANVNSGLILNVSSPSATEWTQVSQRSNSNRLASAQWIIEPVPITIGEDNSYHHIRLNSNPDLYWDIKNWNLDPKAVVGTFPGGGGGAIEQWYFEYAGDNNFFIRSRYSNLVVEIANSSTSVGGTIRMAELTGEKNQLWRLLPIEAKVEFDAPAAPTNLIATPQAASVRLDWTASSSSDVRDYFILRADEGSDDYNTIGRYIAGTTFTDNTAVDGRTYSYRVCAEDESLNRSEPSNIATATPSLEQGFVCHLRFENSLYDETVNGNHAFMHGSPIYDDRSKDGSRSLALGERYAQLPSTIASRNEMTISFWLRRTGAAATTWERVFDFGNGTEQYLFFTPNAGGNIMRFEMKDNGRVETLTYNKTIRTAWNHFAISINANSGHVALYMNGEMVAESDNFTALPANFRPVCNYIGRSQFDADPLLAALVDDFRIYNYPLTASDVAALYQETLSIAQPEAEACSSPSIYNLQGQRVGESATGVVITNGKKVLKNKK